MPPLMLLGVLLIVLAIGVVVLAAAGVAGVPTTGAGPLFIGGVILAIVGAVLRR